MDSLDPQTRQLVLAVVAMAVMLGFTVLALRAVARFFEASDPRRAVVSRVVVWIGTALLIVILLLIRRE